MGDDEPVSTNDLIRIIYESRGKKSRIWNIPKGFINVFASLGAFLHLPLNKERLRKLTENYIVSNDKLKNALGIDKFPVSSKQGLEKTIKSF